MGSCAVAVLPRLRFERLWENRGPVGILRIVCLPCALVAAACSTQELAREHTLDIVRNVNRAFSRETDLALAKAAFPASLKQMEGLLEMYPREPLLLTSLARGYLSYAFMFVDVPRTMFKFANEFEAAQRRERAYELYMRGRGYALRLLALRDPGIAESVEAARIPSKEQLAAAGPDSVPGLYWTARCWGAALATLPRSPEVVRDVTIVRSLVTRCVALNERYEHAGPLVLQAALDAVTPQVMGGGVELARARYERAIELQGGRNLLTRVMYARDVLVPLGEDELYVQSLNEIMRANPTEGADLALANTFAQDWASGHLLDYHMLGKVVR